MSSENFDLKDKRVIITGASRGIGASAARVFANCGAAVMLVARSTHSINQIADEIAADGGRAIAVTADVSQYDDIESVVASCVEHFGGVDVLVNNAGVIEPIGHLATSDPETWAQATDINYKGVYFGLRAAVPVMQEAGGGVILNVSSGAAHHPMEGWSHYCSAKAGAAMLTRSAHLELHQDNIIVMGLSPGTIATDMQIRIKASGLNPVSQLDPDVHADPVWPARALAWMATPAASTHAGEELSLKDDLVRDAIGMSS